VFITGKTSLARDAPMDSPEQGRSEQGSPPPIECCFTLLRTNHIFRLNFSRDISKMRYFSNKFSKIAKRWNLSVPSDPKSSNLVT